MGIDARNRHQPDSANAHLDQAYAYEEIRKFEEALHECDLAIALAPSLADAHNLRGIVLEELDRREEAAQAYKEALRLDPGLEEAASNLSDLEFESEKITHYLDQAYAYEESGKFRMALAKCDEVIALDPSLADAHNLRGIVLEELDRREEAILAYKEALRLDPGFEEVAHNLAELESEAKQEAVFSSGEPSSSRSAGSKLGALAGFIIVVAFFLPWVRACNTEISGYDLAAGDAGRVQVEDPEMYWLVFVAGLACIALFLFFGTRTSARRVGVAMTRLLIGIVGFLPVLNIWANVRQKGEAMKILFGGWLTAAGFLGILISFLIDLAGSSDQREG